MKRILIFLKKYIPDLKLPAILAGAFLLGAVTGKLTSFLSFETVQTSAESSNWGLSFQEEGKKPVANATIEELKQYDAYYAEDTEEKSNLSHL